MSAAAPASPTDDDLLRWDKGISNQQLLSNYSNTIKMYQRVLEWALLSPKITSKSFQYQMLNEKFQTFFYSFFVLFTWSYVMDILNNFRQGYF